jgi:large subunit ribosomal protein L23
MDPYAIIVKPHVTEKTMNLIDQNNELAFVVRRTATKGQIKKLLKLYTMRKLLE